MANPVDLVASALDRWRNNLIDLTRSNPLLDSEAGRTAYLEIAQPDLMKVYDHLRIQGKSWSFYSPPEKPQKNAEAKEPTPRADELLTGASDRQALVQTLTSLYRRLLTEY